MADRILLEGIRIPAALGVTRGERALRRPVLIDLELELELEKAGKTDRVALTIDYSEVYRAVEKTAAERDHRLVEALAERIATALLSQFPIEACHLTVRKQAPIPGPVTSAGVRISRRRRPA